MVCLHVGFDLPGEVVEIDLFLVTDGIVHVR